MTLLHPSARRGVYRVYTEEEFFAAEGLLAAAESRAVREGAQSVLFPVCGRRARTGARLAGFASLGVAIAVVAGVVAMEMRSRAGSDRRSAGRRSASGPRLAERTAWPGVDDRPFASTARASGATPPAGWVGRRRGRGAPVPPRRAAASHTVLLAFARARRPGSALLTASAVGASAASSRVRPPAPAPRSAGASSPPAPAVAGATTTSNTTAASGGAATPGPTPTTTTATATAASAGGARPEFGFER